MNDDDNEDVDVCPECGAELPIDAPKCLACGMEFEDEEGEEGEEEEGEADEGGDEDDEPLQPPVMPSPMPPQPPIEPSTPPPSLPAQPTSRRRKAKDQREYPMLSNVDLEGLIATMAIDEKLKAIEVHAALMPYRHPNGKPITMGDVLTVMKGLTGEVADDAAIGKGKGRAAKGEKIQLDKDPLDIAIIDLHEKKKSLLDIHDEFQKRNIIDFLNEPVSLSYIKEVIDRYAAKQQVAQIKGEELAAAAKPEGGLKNLIVQRRATTIETLFAQLDKLQQAGQTDLAGRVLEMIEKIVDKEEGGGKGDRASEMLTDFMRASIANMTRKDDALVVVEKLLKLNERINPPQPTGEPSEKVMMAQTITQGFSKLSADVKETVLEVTGTPKKTQMEVGQCGQCNRDVPTDAKMCPYCGLVFNPPQSPEWERKTSPGGGASEQDKEMVWAMKDKLRNLAVFIKDKHDPVKKMGMLWELASRDQKESLLFVSVLEQETLFGYAESLLEKYPDMNEVYEICTSPDGQGWLDAATKTIREAAKADDFKIRKQVYERFKAAMEAI